MLFQHYVTDYLRVELDVAAADVQQPCYLVQSGDYHRIGFLGRYLLTDTLQLGCHTLAGKTLFILIERRLRNSRAIVCPKRTNQVHADESQAGLTKLSFHLAVTVDGEHLGVNTHFLALFQHAFQPVVDARTVNV